MAKRLSRCVIGILALASGCKTAYPTRDAEFAGVSRAVQQAMYAPLNPSVEVVNPVLSQLEGPHAVDDYIQFALQQNPDVQAARKKMEALAHQVPVAASLQDPMLNATVQPEQVQTAAGQQELMLSASQKLPWFGKLDARAGVAEAQTNVAQSALSCGRAGNDRQGQTSVLRTLFRSTSHFCHRRGAEITGRHSRCCEHALSDGRNEPTGRPARRTGDFERRD